ncbi:hypothetical protein TMO_c0632 (plasmid) [Tistrella mobilis KA081020-065]|uniref:Uncharacterized protein n=1 Tax=Tistrella mobilis (strain KA081020-065) TaxID=1110502 RepID=I3TWV4_TISMK|nr:hypothetical protein TMO_c0632 [Tistrella mobilis KA081020-065]
MVIGRRPLSFAHAPHAGHPGENTPRLPWPKRAGLAGRGTGYIRKAGACDRLFGEISSA